MVEAKANVRRCDGQVVLELRRRDDSDSWALMSPGAARALAQLLVVAAEKADAYNARSTRTVAGGKVR